MSFTWIKCCIETLKEAETNEEIYCSLTMIIELGKQKKITDIEAEQRVEILEHCDILRLLQTDVAIAGVSASEITGSVLSVLSWFVHDPQLCVHRKMLELLPYIGKIITTQNDDPEDEVCVPRIEESCHILSALSRHQVVMAEMLKYNMVNVLCYAAGALKVGYSDTAHVLGEIARVHGENIWSREDSAGLNFFLSRYTEAMEKVDGDLKWQFLSTIRHIIISIDPNVLELYEIWVNRLREIIAYLIDSKPDGGQRNDLLAVACLSVKMFGVLWALNVGFKFLLQLITLVSLEICVGLQGREKEDVLSNDSTFTTYCYFLEQVMNYFNNNNYIPERLQIAKVTNGAIRAICGFLKMMNDRMDQPVKDRNDVDEEGSIEDCAHNGTNNHDYTQMRTGRNEGVKSEQDIHCNDEKRGHNLPSDLNSAVEDLSLEASTNIPILSRLEIRSIGILWSWFVTPPGSLDKEMIDVIPYFVRVGHYTNWHCNEKANGQDCVLDDTARRRILDQLVFLFNKLMKFKESFHVLLRENLLGLLHEYFQFLWAEYNKAQKIVRVQSQELSEQQSQKSVPDTSHEDRDKGAKESEQREAVGGDAAYNKKHTSDALFPIEYKMRNLMTALMSGIRHTVLLGKTHQTFPALYSFAITHLPYFETSENAIISFHVMIMGLTLFLYLSKNNENPEHNIAFFESCVSLLSQVHQTRSARRGQHAIVVVTHRYEEIWNDVDALWHGSMEILANCITVCPAITECVRHWIPDILDMLKQAKATNTSVQLKTSFHLVLCACAKYSAECKSIIQQNNGLRIARKCRFDKLETLLKSQ